MEKEIVRTIEAQTDFWQIVGYLAEQWPDKVLDNFNNALDRKIQLLKKQTNIGFKSKKYSKFRKTIVAHFTY
jgi:hypothetical protein